MKRKIYHVVKHGDEWQVRREGARRPTSRHLTKECAIDWARTLVLLAQVPAQLIVHSRDGRIQTEWTYGDDPLRSPG